jgi:predicted RND superfamily exporter protein
MAMLFKHINLLVISLIPNIVPLVVAGGVLGFTGLVFNASSAIVFTIGFVIAVDNTIHFLSRFRIELMTSSGIQKAIQITFQKTGKAMILTSAILLLGFLVLFRSELKGVFTQGVLFSSIIVSALFGDIFLLPVLLRLFLKDKSRIKENNSAFVDQKDNSKLG